MKRDAIVRATWGLALGVMWAPSAALCQGAEQWPIHSLTRPRPRVIDPGPPTASPRPPADATILFDGQSLAAWRSTDGSGRPAPWLVGSGYFEVKPRSGDIETREAFGDVQLHIEWATPATPAGSGQERGNSGVFLMGRYEVQILDSYQNDTYPDGQAAAVYGQTPPLVNASRKPGEWQTYDIVFRRPRFSAQGGVEAPARVTVFHNGVLVHDAVALIGPTSHQVRRPYEAHPDRLPLRLQDHGNTTRFRNVWVRELPEWSATP